ncbi:MAG: hypothetical protein H0W88_07835 [Parachlamydiaceae bacterium]|nr:hypothetical protein [Parachlamydiaceae bacterium]
MSENENMNLQDETSENQSLNPQEFHGEGEKEVFHEDESHHSQDSREPKRKDSKDIHQIQFDTFTQAFQAQNNVEEKLQLAIQFMEDSLSQGGTPHFRNFWEARRLCLPLFKENISPQVRGLLWNKYSELSKEARRLKDLLDEQSAFAIEQIEIAIKALENDIENYATQSHKSPFPQDLIFPQSLQKKHSFYLDLQQKLNVLNVQASRINALRKELLKTEMRVRQKNKFFQSLSLAGDKVFPQRKEHIKLISSEFITDVDQFIKGHFSEGNLSHEASLFNLREEIKALQGLAKVLTLNTNAFTNTRARLSEAWDQIKSREKERKKERAQQRVGLRQNFETVQQAIQDFKTQFEDATLSTSDAQKKMDDLVAFMRRTELDRDDLKKLREELNEVKKPLQDKLKLEEEAKHKQEKERILLKKEKYNTLKNQIETLIQQNDSYNEDQLVAQREDILNQIQDSSLVKTEKLELERILKPLRDIITEKKEKSLMALSDDDRQALQQLQEILQQRKIRRQEIKAQLETLRKASGSSSLDFEKAMEYNQLVTEEKERNEKINQGIKEIEDKIAQLQSKIKAKS